MTCYTFYLLLIYTLFITFKIKVCEILRVLEKIMTREYAKLYSFLHPAAILSLSFNAKCSIVITSHVKKKACIFKMIKKDLYKCINMYLLQIFISYLLSQFALRGKCGFRKAISSCPEGHVTLPHPHLYGLATPTCPCVNGPVLTRPCVL